VSQVFKRKKADAASTTASVTSNSQFKVVASKQNSLMPQSGHPDGWVNRTAEQEKISEQGEEWRSDAYDIKPHAITKGAQPARASA